MAEQQDTDLSYSQLNAGDQIFDLCCTPCSKKKWNKQAIKYCVICNEYFCNNCVDSHNSFQALSGHVLVDPQVMKPTSSGSRKEYHTVPTELCKRHHLKLVDMYCGNHDTVGCSVCFTLDHKWVELFTVTLKSGEKSSRFPLNWPTLLFLQTLFFLSTPFFCIWASRSQIWTLLLLFSVTILFKTSSGTFLSWEVGTYVRKAG